MRLAEVFVSWIVDDNVSTNAFVIIVCKCIIHVSEDRAQWILIKVSVVVSLVINWAIAKCSFFYIKPEVAAYDDIRRTLYEWRDLILYNRFYHTIVTVSCKVSYFQLNHDRSGTYVAAGEWNAWAVYCTTVTAVYRWNTTWYIIYTCSFCCPVEVNASFHTAYTEFYRSAVVI